MKGVIASNSGIVAEFSKRIKENAEKTADSTLSKEIARYTFLLGTRIEAAKDVDRLLKLNAAINILTQAQTTLSSDPREARKLYNLAKRIGK